MYRYIFYEMMAAISFTMEPAYTRAVCFSVFCTGIEKGLRIPEKSYGGMELE